MRTYPIYDHELDKYVPSQEEVETYYRLKRIEEEWQQQEELHTEEKKVQQTKNKEPF